MIRLNNSQLIAEISIIGAELNYLSRSKGKNIMWTVDERYWNRCAPLLFPIVGRLKNNCYRWNNQEYQMNQHGFARDAEFEVLEQTTDTVTFKLCANPSTLKVFPFHFELHVTYTLRENTLINTYTMMNRGHEPLPFSIGGHPGFALEDALENYTLHFPNPFVDQRHLIQEGLYTGETKEVHFTQHYPLKTSDFENDAIVLKQPQFSQVTLAHKGNQLLTLQCDDWSAVGFWTKPTAPFFCIEPWWGWADRIDASGELSEKEGVNWLKPNEQKSVSFSILVHEFTPKQNNF